MDLVSPAFAGPVGYYRAVAPVLLTHLRGGRVQGFSARSTDLSDTVPMPEPPATTDELIALVDRGIAGFVAAHAGGFALHLAPGAGADVATAATAALRIVELCTADHLGVVAVTDGADGLCVLARTDGDPAPTAQRYAALLTSQAPELATTDPAQADGRCLLRVQTGPVPAPYTLLPARGGSIGVPAGAPDGAPDGAAAIPLHPDEVAAITAGMPLELGAADVPGRLATRGDLAAVLLAGPAG